jgi:hypothetical protein
MPNKHFPTKVKVRIPRIRPPDSATIDDSTRNFDLIDSNVGDLVPWGASNNHSMLAKPKVSVVVVDKGSTLPPSRLGGQSNIPDDVSSSNGETFREHMNNRNKILAEQEKVRRSFSI